MSLDLGKNFSTDDEKEEEGVWEDFGDGAGLLVASSSSERFMKLYRKVPTGIREQMNNGKLPDKIAREIMAGIFSKAILLGWKKLSDEGKEISYSEENAKQYLLKYKRFALFVWKLAEDDARYENEEIEEEVKNSKSSSSGS
jgi:hypothetical protein